MTIDLNEVRFVGILPGVKVAIAILKDGTKHRLTHEQLNQLQKMGRL